MATKNGTQFTVSGVQDAKSSLEKLREILVEQDLSALIGDPRRAEVINKYIDDLHGAFDKARQTTGATPDGGLADLIGVGPNAGVGLGDSQCAAPVTPYDDTVAAERISAVADLYYLFQHEMIGVFRVILKLQDLFKGGNVRLSSGNGAMALYRFDRQQVLRYTVLERRQAYLRAFGYGGGPAATGSLPNREFHSLFSNFVTQVALFFRDKRISEVVRDRATDPSFGSIAIVRRAGLDLRYNLKNFSYGHLRVLSVEVGNELTNAFTILRSPDVMQLFGAQDEWDVIEDVLRRYFGESVNVSPRSRMAITGQSILMWLTHPYILKTTRTEFEAHLTEIAESCEEWLTSAQTIRGNAPSAARPRLPVPVREGMVG